jgi:hypothetical protein
MQEAFWTDGSGKLCVEHLEGDRSLVPKVPGQVDRGHAAAAELALNPVAVNQSGLKAGSVIGQVGSGEPPLLG